mmetsp:Transcript_89992/g.263051  ORF Transcript_89992/g.263051 Transcript_89992/m.263051 type:complete len:354 (-) Transcript_89992:430-1491(-)
MSCTLAFCASLSAPWPLLPAPWPSTPSSARPQGPQGALGSAAALAASASASRPLSPIGFLLSWSSTTPEHLGTVRASARSPQHVSGEVLRRRGSCSSARKARWSFRASAKHSTPRSRMVFRESLNTSREALQRMPSARSAAAASSRPLPAREQLLSPQYAGSAGAFAGSCSCQVMSSTRDLDSAPFHEAPSAFLSRSRCSRLPPPWRAASSTSCTDRPLRPLPAMARCLIRDSWHLNAPASSSAKPSGETLPAASCPAVLGGMTSEKLRDSSEGAAPRAVKSAASSMAEEAALRERSSRARLSAATAREAKPAEQRPTPSRTREPRQPCVFSSIARAAAPASPSPELRLRSRA